MNVSEILCKKRFSIHSHNMLEEYQERGKILFRRQGKASSGSASIGSVTEPISGENIDLHEFPRISEIIDRP